MSTALMHSCACFQTLPTALTCTDFGGGVPVTDPNFEYEMSELVWTHDIDGIYNGELTLGAVNLQMTPNRVVSPANPEPSASLDTFAFNGMIPGPLIRFKACNTYKLRLVNGLVPIAGEATTTIPYTNLHLHGMHVSGEDPADDVVTVQVPPGGDHYYSYRIPCDHASGTHLYHPHFAGTTAMQALGGAVGMIIVEGSALEAAHTPGQYESMPEYPLVIQEMDLQKLKEYAGEYQLLAVVATANFPDAPPSTVLVNGCERRLGAPSTSPSSPFNGMTFKVEAGQWTKLRILNVANDKNAIITVMPSDYPLKTHWPCEVKVLAKDGVTVDNMPRTVYGQENGLFASLASRIDVALAFAGATAADDVAMQQTQTVIASIIVTTSNRAWADDLARHYPCRPVYLDLNSGVRTVYPAPEPAFDLVAPAIAVQWPNSGRQFQIDHLEKWNLRASFDHPFHTHVNHMRLGDVNDDVNQVPGAPFWNNEGDWIDTVAIPGDSIPVTLRPERYAGKMVLHCHVQKHADGGMAAVANIAHHFQDYTGPLDDPTMYDSGTCCCPPADTKRTPYNDAPFFVSTGGATIPAVFFDRGGEGIAYHNLNIAPHKPTYLELTSLPPIRDDDAAVEMDYDPLLKDNHVAFIRNGEWLKYTISVYPPGGSWYKASIGAALVLPPNGFVVGHGPGMHYSLWLDNDQDGCPAPGQTSKGWLATVNDSEWAGARVDRIQPYPADGTLKFHIPQGEHTVTLCFEGSVGHLNLFYLHLQWAGFNA
ncbi:Cupredoxin [Tribonema minus]|uniref:Cupredoxin n=1 Tax=Tribonema minus TaxID=303371 RepID=A0A836CQZ2_9STRA|nr:Cupredoxin [Tribonema minus]